MKYSFLQNGDMALTVQFKNEISREVNGCVSSLCAGLEKKAISGVTEMIPVFSSLTVCYDCTVISAKKLKKKIKALISSVHAVREEEKRIFLIPVCYEEPYAPDMKNVMVHTGLCRDEIIRLHSSRDYLIYMMGFLPGFAYLGGMDSVLVTPRLETPRTVIPAGSVGIGGEQTGIYPVDSPGGWQLIGRTPVKVYDLSKKEPVLFSAGDYIRFLPVPAEEYDRIERQVNDGAYALQILEEGGL